MEDSTSNLNNNIPVGSGSVVDLNEQIDVIDDDEGSFYGVSPLAWLLYHGERTPVNVANPDTFANYLTDGYWEDIGYPTTYSWQQDNITYSFIGFSESQKNGFHKAFDLWADVADITFSEVAYAGNINIIEDVEGYSASGFSSVAGDFFSNGSISVGTKWGQYSNIDEIGNSDFVMALHEIGHVLGLGHTGNYNGGTVFYSNDAQWQNDTQQMTIMSYFDDMNVGSDHWDSSNVWQYSATPMLIDILAIQNIYGADYTTRNGDTVYGFNSNAGRDQFDFTISEAPIAIWDGGGNDTLDLSGYDTNQTIYLTEGYFSSVGHMTSNLVIAYGAEIENAIGGSGHDLIYGNELHNELVGNAGNDIFFGGLGDDEIQGGSGSDSLIYNYSISDFVHSVINTTTISLTHLTEGFTDLITDVEKFVFHEGSYDFSELSGFGNITNTTKIGLFWDSGKFIYKLPNNGSITLDADDIKFSGAIGDQLQIIKSDYTTNITILNSNAPNVVRFSGSDSADTISIDGAHIDFSGKIRAGDMNDIITMIIDSDDYLYGESGDDKINAGAGIDKLYGGDGHDILNGEAGDDVLFGGVGNDVLSGGVGDDILRGEEGADELRGNMGNDKLDGGDGDDLIFGGLGNDRIVGGSGDDRIIGGEGNDIIRGGEGSDTIHGDDGNDRLFGDGGDDIIAGWMGDDKIDGGEGNDTLLGDEGSDILIGGGGDDYLFGGDGNDRLKGGAGNDFLQGDDGDDIIFGGDGHDLLLSEDGNGTLYGENGNDTLYAYEGTNKLYGGNDDDLLLVYDGLNILYGNSGHDTFDLNTIHGGIDQIKDFTLNGADSDILNITDILTSYTSGVDNIKDFVMLNYKNAGRTDLLINSDGQGDDFVQVAIIRGSDLLGVGADDLLASGHLVADVTNNVPYADF